MAVLGDATLWTDLFPENLIPAILDLVIATWSSFNKPSSDELEVPITRRFRIALLRSRDNRRLPVRIDREAVEDDPKEGEERGRIDLRFTAGSIREEAYFAFECKRLNARLKGRIVPLAGKYVEDGMMRFVESQYGSTQRHGGMIAYVLDGDLSGALNRLNRNIKNKRVRLRMEGIGRLEMSSILEEAPEVRETID